MARPKNKAELIEESRKSFQSLMTFVNELGEEDQVKEFTPGMLNRNVRDVLMHLHHWHLLMREWYEVGMNGEKPHMPAEGYTWKTTPALNQWIQQHYSDTTLTTAKVLLQDSYEDVLKLIRDHSDEELFTKKRYAWTGSTSLGAYLISATWSHYRWALKLIKKCLK